MFRDEKGGERGRKSILKAKRPGSDHWAFPGPAMGRSKGVGGNGYDVASQLANLHATFDTSSKRGISLCIYVGTRNTRAEVLEFQKIRGSKTVNHADLYSYFLLVSTGVLWEAEVKMELDFLGEMPVKVKEKRSRSRWRGPSHHDVGLTPVKGRGEEEREREGGSWPAMWLREGLGQANEVLPSMCGQLEEPRYSYPWLSHWLSRKPGKHGLSMKTCGSKGPAAGGSSQQDLLGGGVNRVPPRLWFQSLSYSSTCSLFYDTKTAPKLSLLPEPQEFLHGMLQMPSDWKEVGSCCEVAFEYQSTRLLVTPQGLGWTLRPFLLSLVVGWIVFLKKRHV